MALIDTIDGLVFNAFQQNFISNYALDNSPGVNYPAPPGAPAENRGQITFPWPPENNPSQISSVPKNLPLHEGIGYSGAKLTFGKDLYDGSQLSLTNGGPFSVPGLPSFLRPADAFATAHWLRNVGKELFGNMNFQDGITTALKTTVQSKGFQFVSSQLLLSALNPTDPEVGGRANTLWNPASLIASVLPGTRPTDITSITGLPGLGRSLPSSKFDTDSSRIDKYIAETKILTQALPERKPEEILGKTLVPSKLPALFKSPSGFDIIREIAAGEKIRRPKDVPIVHARIIESGDGDIDGIIELGQQPPDDQIYMPLVFQDLRDKTPQLLYFRAFIKPDSVTENFTPSWNISKYYGRVDDIPIYMGTTRIINLAFDIVAWQPADLPIIYRKLHKLQSMVYPFFNSKGFLSAGPIIRMRLGDLFSTTNKGKLGLPGYLTSLDVVYDNVWNIEKDFKIPRKATISISFTVLHEQNPGTYPISENSNEFPTFGIGEFDDIDEIYKGHETGIRGLLNNIKRDRELKAKPATSEDTTPSSQGA